MTQPIRQSKKGRSRSPHARLFGTGELIPTARCAVIVAHPADEVVGAGCLISRLNDVTILHVTDGAPIDIDDVNAAGFHDRLEYAAARQRECVLALELAHVPRERIVDLNVIEHQAPNCLTDLAKKIAVFLQQNGADIVVTHPYEGGHPDHDATAFATHAALRLMEEKGFTPPALFEMALHPSEDGMAKLPQFLPGPARETTTLLLDETARALKQRMFDCFETQRESLELSPVGPERFRQSATYDFTNPPKPGTLHYENFEEGFEQTHWQTLARTALTELFPNGNYH